MNDKHNFGFDTECKIIKPNGKVREIITDLYQPRVEGIVSVDTFGSDGMPKQHVEQPMRSFVKNFIYTHFILGLRPSNESQSLIKNTNNAASLMASTGSTPVSINDTVITNPVSPNTQSQLGFIHQMPIYNSETQTVDLMLRKEGQVNAGGSLREVGLHARDNSFYYLVSRDLITPVSVKNGDMLRITITLRFPASTEKAMLNNFFLNLIQLYAVNPFTIYKDISGANATSILGSYVSSGLTYANYISIVNAGVVNKGIVVGSGNNNVDWENDYALQTPITSGSGAGQLVANACTLAANSTALIVSGSSALMEHWREFQNTSTGNITVREAGVISEPQTTLFTPLKRFMLARWLTGDVVVRPGETLRVSWRPKVTV